MDRWQGTLKLFCILAGAGAIAALSLDNVTLFNSMAIVATLGALVVGLESLVVILGRKINPF